MKITAAAGEAGRSDDVESSKKLPRVIIPGSLEAGRSRLRSHLTASGRDFKNIRPPVTQRRDRR